MVSADLEEYASAFSALADESRLELLVSVCRESSPHETVRFSEAMAAAEFEDSGRFNYHLDQLRENFLFERGDAYLPTTAAREAFVAMRSGRLADNDLDVRRATLDATCLGCGRPLVAEYQYDFLVWCPRCGRSHFEYPVGPEVVADADLADLARELDRAARAGVRAQLEHRCPRCGGESRAWFTDDCSQPFPSDPAAATGCSNCGHWVRYHTVGALLCYLPSVQDYCDEHGIDLHERPQWGYHWARTDAATEVRSRDPWHVVQHAHVDGCRLRVVLEAEGAVADVDHVPVDGRFER